jgi:hypothetical protein
MRRCGARGKVRKLHLALDLAQNPPYPRLRALDPALRLSNLRDFLPFRREQDFALWAEGLRLAGLPE